MARYTTLIIFIAWVFLNKVQGSGLWNVALGKPTYQSSVYSFEVNGVTHQYGESWLAVDGNKSTVFDNGSCMQTDQDPNPWWLVDLERLHMITHVELSTTHQFDRLANFTIETSQYLDGDPSHGVLINPTLCFYHELFQTISPVVYPCYKTVMGRYVKITRFHKKNRRLCICEADVYGTDMRRFFTAILRPGKRSLNPVVDNHIVTSTLHCSALCRKDQSCTSFNIQLTSEMRKTCELVADPVPWLFNNEESNAEWIHVVFDV